MVLVRAPSKRGQRLGGRRRIGDSRPCPAPELANPLHPAQEQVAGVRERQPARSGILIIFNS